MDIKEKYVNFMRDLEILDLYLVSVNYKKNSNPNSKYPCNNVSLLPTKSNYIQTQKDNYKELKISLNLEFKLTQCEEHQCEKQDSIFELNANYEIFYKVSEEITDDIFNLFIQNNVPFNVHPYIRELVHDSMTRTGLRPFVLPVIKSFK